MNIGKLESGSQKQLILAGSSHSSHRKEEKINQKKKKKNRRYGIHEVNFIAYPYQTSRFFGFSIISMGCFPGKHFPGGTGQALPGSTSRQVRILTKFSTQGHTTLKSNESPKQQLN
jgi:hypothetical protein